MTDFVYGLTLDPEQAKAALRDFASAAKGTATEINSAMEIVQKVWGAVSGAVGFAVGRVKEWTAASADAEKTQRRLEAAVGSGYGKLAQYNSALAEKLGLDDDDIAKAQTKLLALGLNQSQLEQATKATLGLAAATDKDLLAATGKVAKAFEKSADEAARMTSLYAIAEAETETFEGRVRALTTAWADMDETLGSAVTQSKGAQEGLGVMRDLVTEITGFLDSDKGRRFVDSFFVAIAHGAADGIDALLGMVKMARALNAELKPAEAHITPGMKPDEIKKRIADAAAGIRTPGPDPEWMQYAAGVADRLRGIRGGTEGDFIGPPAPGPGGDGVDSKASKAPKRDPYDGGPNFRSGGGIAGGFGLPGSLVGLLKADLKEEEKLRDQQDALRLQALNREGEKAAFSANLHEKQLEKRKQQHAAELAQERQFYGQLISIGVGGVTSFLSSSITAWASGEATLGQAAGRAFGGMLSQVGQGLFALGSAAVAAGLLGSVAPIFAPATGGPLGMAAGAGLMAAGLALIGVGGFVGAQFKGGSAGGGSAAGSASTSVAPTSFDQRGFDPSRNQAPGPQVTNLYVSVGAGALMVGTERGLALAIEDVLAKGRTLNPVTRRPR